MKEFFYSIAVLLTVILAQSCLKNTELNPDIDRISPNGIVTVKTSADNTIYLQLDDQTTLLPVNITKHPFDNKEVRALLNYEEVNEKHDGYTKAVMVNWIDSILTKPVIPYVKDNNEEYGEDPIDIDNNTSTAIEDGYITLLLRSSWGNISKPHRVELLTGTNPDDPYELVLRHNAYGDIYGRQANSYVAFDLSPLPDTKGETVKIKLIWRTPNGIKNALIDYKTKAK